LIYRPTGRSGEERVSQTFRSTDEGHKAAFVVTTELENADWLRADSATVHGGARYPPTLRADALASEAVV